MNHSHTEKLNQLLKRVEKPGRYIGGEIHSVKKDPEKVKGRFAFCFPDLYEIGMSYLGMQILYKVINSKENQNRSSNRKYMENAVSPFEIPHHKECKAYSISGCSCKQKYFA